MAIGDLPVPETGAVTSLPIPETGLVRRPDELEQEAFRATAGSFRRGLRSSVISLGATANALAGSAADAMGLTEFARSRFADAEAMVRDADAVAPAIRDHRVVKDLSDAVDFVTGLAGQAAGSVLPTLAGGAVGAGLRGTAGAVAGAMAGSFVPEAGEQALRVKDAPGTTAVDRFGNAVAKGGINAALDVASLAVPAGAVARGLRGAAPRLLPTVGKTTAAESGTETLQELTGQALHTRLEPGRDKAEDAPDMVNAALGGAVGGAMFGGVGGLAAKLGSRPWTRDDVKQKLGIDERPEDPAAVPGDDVPDQDLPGWFDAQDGKLRKSAEEWWGKVKDMPWAKQFDGWREDPEKFAGFTEAVQKHYRDTVDHPSVRKAAEKFKGFVDRIRPKGDEKSSELRTALDVALYDNMVKHADPEKLEALSPAERLQLADDLKHYALHTFGQRDPVEGPGAPQSRRQFTRPAKSTYAPESMLPGDEAEAHLQDLAAADGIRAPKRTKYEGGRETLPVQVPHALMDFFGDRLGGLFETSSKILGAGGVPMQKRDFEKGIKRAEESRAGDTTRLEDIVAANLVDEAQTADPTDRALAVREITRRIGRFMSEGAPADMPRAQREARQAQFESDMATAFGGRKAAVMAAFDRERENITRGYEHFQDEDKVDMSPEAVAGRLAKNERVRVTQEDAPVGEEKKATKAEEASPYRDKRLGRPIPQDQLGATRDALYDLYGKKNVRLRTVPEVETHVDPDTGEEREVMTGRHTIHMDDASAPIGFTPEEVAAIRDKHSKAGLANNVVSVVRVQRGEDGEPVAAKGGGSKNETVAVSIPNLSALVSETMKWEGEKDGAAYVRAVVMEGMSRLMSDPDMVRFAETSKAGGWNFPDSMKVGKFGDKMWTWGEVKEQPLKRRELMVQQMSSDMVHAARMAESSEEIHEDILPLMEFNQERLDNVKETRENAADLAQAKKDMAEALGKVYGELKRRKMGVDEPIYEKEGLVDAPTEMREAGERAEKGKERETTQEGTGLPRSDLDPPPGPRGPTPGKPGGRVKVTKDGKTTELSHRAAKERRQDSADFGEGAVDFSRVDSKQHFQTNHLSPKAIARMMDNIKLRSMDSVKIGTSTVHFSKNIQKAERAAAQAWVNLLKLPKDVVVTHIDDILPSHGLIQAQVAEMGAIAGAAAAHATVNNRSWIVLFNNEKANTPEKRLTYLAHELGHAFDAQVLSTPEYAKVRAAMALKFSKHLSARAKDPAAYLLNRHTPTGVLAMVEDLASQEFRDFDEMGHALAHQFDNADDYYNQFKEWWAEQTAKFLTTDAKVLDEVDGFFKGLAEKIRSFVEDLVRKVAELSGRSFTGKADPRVQEFYNDYFAGKPHDSMVDRARRAWVKATPRQRATAEAVWDQEPMIGITYNKTDFGDDSRIDTKFVELSRVGTGPEIRVTPEEQQAVREFVERVLGRDAAVRFLEGLESAGAFARINGVETLAISMRALDPMSVGYHEAAHAMLARIMDANPKAANALMAAAGAPNIQAKLRQLLKGEPGALRQIKESAVERVAYMYQFWANGQLEMGPRATSVFQDIKDFFRKTARMLLGVGTDPDAERQAQLILQAFHDGRLADRSDVARVISGIIPAQQTKTWLARLGDTADKLWSTGDGYVRDFNIPAMTRELDKIMSPPDSDQPSGMLQTRHIQSNKFRNRMHDALQGLDDAAKARVLSVLRGASLSRDSGTGPAIGRTNTEANAARQMRALLDDMFQYMKDKNVKAVVWNDELHDYEELDISKVEDFFPRMYDKQAIGERMGDFVAMLERHGVENARETALKLINPPKADPSESDFTAGITHYAPTTLARKIKIPDAELEPFLKKDLESMMYSYIGHVVRRGEYASRFGNQGQGIAEAARKAELQGATLEQVRSFNQYVQAAEGTLGNDIDKDMPGMRQFFGAAMTYQNLRLLPLALFSSLVDPNGIILRGGTAKEGFGAFVRGVRELVSDKQDEQREFARTVGAITDAVDEHMVADMYGATYAGEWQKWLNRKLFKLNGMESWNSSMRIVAATAAKNFIVKHSQNPGPHSERWLSELGLTADDVRVDGGRLDLTPQVVDAINKWVDGAVLRPHAGVRPIWMSDPHFMLVSHLKQFAYGFQKTIVSRTAHEAMHGNYTPLAVLGSYVPLIIAADVLRAVATPGSSDNDRLARWTMGDWVQHGISRAGITGPGQYALDSMVDVKHGRIGIESIGGPTVQQLSDIAHATFGRGDLAKEGLRALPLVPAMNLKL